METLNRLPPRELTFLNFVLAAVFLTNCGGELSGPNGQGFVGVWVNQSGRSTNGVEVALGLNRDW